MDPYPGERAPRPARRYASGGANGTGPRRAWDGAPELRGSGAGGAWTEERRERSDEGMRRPDGPGTRASGASAVRHGPSGTGGRVVPVSGDPDPELDIAPPPLWRRRGRRRRAMPLWQELPLLLIVAFCLAVLIRTFLLQAFYIPSSSMETTLLIGDRVLVNKIVYTMRDPARGEVVVFRGTAAWAPEVREALSDSLAAKISRTAGDLIGFSQPGEKDFIKRVIGLPGDTVQCCDPDGRVLVNGKALDESAYLPAERNSPLDAPPTPGQCGPRVFGPVTVPAGQIFVMGDNRVVSQDSRCQGPVPIENVIGRAFAVAWPSDRWHGLPALTTFQQQAVGAPDSPSELPAKPDTGAAWVFLAPFLAALAIPARSRRSWWGHRRRLSE
jgi:signal peptidase I